MIVPRIPVKGPPSPSILASLKIANPLKKFLLVVMLVSQKNFITFHSTLSTEEYTYGSSSPI